MNVRDSTQIYLNILKDFLFLLYISKTLFQWTTPVRNHTFYVLSGLKYERKTVFDTTPFPRNSSHTLK